MRFSIHTVQTRLLASFGLVATLTLLAALVGFLSFSGARSALTVVVEEAAPLRTAAQRLDATSSAITGELAAFARSQDSADQASARERLNTLLGVAEQSLQGLAAAGLAPSRVEGLTLSLADLSGRVDAAAGPVSAKLEAQAIRTSHVSAALQERSEAALGLEATLDDASDPATIETLLRTIMALNLIATQYAELDGAATVEAVNVVESRFEDAADELFVNLAILGNAIDDSVRVPAMAVLDHAEGETGIFESRRAELAALMAADVAVEEARLAHETLAGLTGQVSQDAERSVDSSTANGYGAITLGQTLLSVIALGALLVSAAIGILYVNNHLLRRLTRISTAMSALAAGDTSHEVDESGHDEITAMARAVEVFRENAIERQRLESETASDRAAREARTRTIEALVADFEKASERALTAVSGAANEMEMAAHALTESSQGASQRTAEVNEAGATAAENVDTVAAAAEEMTSSISEIAQQISRSSNIAQQAASRVEQANGDVHTLSEAARKIDGVVKLINDIAEQTNLLALNATIEAARAGEAGKGFAVVASEVKTLASQTANATGSISEQIAGIQGATEKAVAAIANIGGVIAEMNEISTAIAAAMEEQRAAASEITRSAHQAATGARTVSQAIQGVDANVSETGQCAAQVNQSATSLNGEAAGLREAVSRFLSGVRAA